MRQAVTAGSSAQGLLGLPVTAAAKTGTAQFGSEGKTHAWITTFAPYEKPQIVITVLLEAGGEGSSAALPVAKAGLENYFSQK
jgi:penicillin-binding protein 2